MPIITEAEARQAIPSLTSANTDLALVIDRVEMAIARYLRLPTPSAGGSPTLAAYAVVLYNDGETGAIRVDGDTLRLGVRPVSTVVVYQDTTEEFAAGSIVSADDYHLDLERGLVRLKATASTSWYDVERSIKVTCNVGWSTAPKDLKQAVIETVAHTWRRRGIGATDQGGKDDDVAIPGFAREVLGPYRLLAGAVG